MENVTTTSFEEAVLKSDIPVVVDFWAEWCQPCKAIMPKLEELSQEFDGKVKFVKVNADSEDDLLTKFGIMSIPTLIFFNNGELKDMTAGNLPKAEIESRVSALL